MSVIIYDADTTSVQLPMNGATSYTVRARWTHPGYSSYDVERIDVQFVPGRDYYAIQIRSSDNTTLYRSEQEDSGGYDNVQQTIEIPQEAWTGQNGGAFRLVFSRPSYHNATYSGIRLQVTYKAKAAQSMVSVADAEAGQAQTAIITNAEPSVKHTVTWEYPGGVTSGPVSVPASQTGQTTTSWTVPAASLPALYAAVTDRTQATGTVTVTTLLEDDTVVGTSAYPAVLTFPASIGPAATVTTDVTLDAIGQAMHTANSSWAIISGHSTFTMDVAAQAQYGASVTGILLSTPDGMVSIANGGSGSIEIRTGGSWTWTLTVTDSRGIHTVTTGTLTVRQATPPAITALEAVRWTTGDAGGDQSDEGQYARIRVTKTDGTPTAKNLFDGVYPDITQSVKYRAVYVGTQTVTVSSTITQVTVGSTRYSNLFAIAGNVTSGAATGTNDVYAGCPRTIIPISGYITIAYRNWNSVNPETADTQIEIGTSATAYEPYVGVTTVAYAITQAGTGGSVETGTISGDTYAGSGLLLKDRAYLLTVVLTDAYGRTAAASIEIPSAVYTIHRMAGGKGVAFGQTADRYGVEVTESWPFYAHGQEIMELVLDMAHPPGSILETIDGNSDPNVLWQWTEWAEADTGQAGAIITHRWIRAR